MRYKQPSDATYCTRVMVQSSRLLFLLGISIRLMDRARGGAQHRARGRGRPRIDPLRDLEGIGNAAARASPPARDRSAIAKAAAKVRSERAMERRLHASHAQLEAVRRETATALQQQRCLEEMQAQTCVNLLSHAFAVACPQLLVIPDFKRRNLYGHSVYEHIMLLIVHVMENLEVR